MISRGHTRFDTFSLMPGAVKSITLFSPEDKQAESPPCQGGDNGGSTRRDCKDKTRSVLSRRLQTPIFMWCKRRTGRVRLWCNSLGGLQAGARERGSNPLLE